MRKGFTLIELIFVIVILGILSKFGADILYKIYENYVYSNTFNRLQNQSEAAVKQIANRLQYRIKDSTIARSSIGSASIKPIGSNDGTETVLEWIGTDVEGWRGTSAASTLPQWSGFIDLSDSNETTLVSPGTAVMNGDLAIFFIGSDVNLNSSSFGWDGTNISTQNAATHKVNLATAGQITPAVGGTFAGIDVYEYYELSKSAYAVSLEDFNNGAGNLYLYHEYQPWSGETANADGNRSLLMENVSSFKFTSMGDILIVQVCVKDKNDVTGVGGYSICKEKVVF